MRSYRTAFAVFAGLLLLASLSFAQSTLGSITVSVTDPQGAFIPGARVTLSGVDTNVKRTEMAGAEGSYVFAGVAPGNYIVTVVVSGFRELRSSVLTQTAAQNQRFDAKLEMGETSSSIEVTATPTTMNTENAEISSLQTAEQVLAAPTQRAIMQMAGLTPSTVFDGSSIMIGGNRNSFLNLTIDGIQTMQNAYGGQSGNLTNDQSYESIAEVKVLESNNSAEFPGVATLMTTTKSGGNQLHGSGFYTTDNSALNAGPLTQGSERSQGIIGPQLQWWGGSVSGPVYVPKIYNGKNKTFFLVTEEHRTFPLAAGNSSTGTTTLPTAAFEAGNFAALLDPINGSIQLKNPLTGQPIPGNNFANAGLQVNPVSAAFATKYYPAPNYTGTSTNPNNYLNNYRNTIFGPEHIDRFDVRIDHNISSKDALSGRFTRQVDPWQRSWNPPVPGYGYLNIRNSTNDFISETHIFKPTLLNEFRLGFERDAIFRNPQQDGNTFLKATGLSLGGTTVPAGTPGLPDMEISGGFFDLYPNPISNNISQQYELLDNLSWQKGRHAIKTGVLVRYGDPILNSQNNQFGQYNFNGQYTGFGLADFMLGYPSQVRLKGPALARYNRKTDTGLYVNDTWSVSPKLTLTLGVRWEYFMPSVDNNDRRVNWDPATQAVVVPSQATLQYTAIPQDIPVEVAPKGFPGRSLMYGNWNNFGPRVGLAYRFNDKTVVRGGYGVYYGELIGAYQDNFGPGSQDVFSAGSLRLNNTTPLPTLQFPNPFGTATTALGVCAHEADCGDSITATNPHLKTPMIQQWNFTVERDLGRSMVARVSYRGSMSTQLPVFYNLNLPQASTSDLTNVYNYSLWTGGNINYETDGAIQKSTAFDVAVERKFAKGLQFQMAYTYSKNMTDSSVSNGESGTATNPYDRHYDWGNNTLIPRQRLVPTVLWEIPYGKGKAWGGNSSGVVNAILGEWEVSSLLVIQSGTYFSPTFDGSSWLQVRNGQANRPNCTGGNPYTGNSGWSWENNALFLNAAAFSVPAAGTYGNCPANSLVGPGAWTANLGLHKSFSLTERIKLKFEGNFMNLFNHPNKSNPNADLSAGFGQITSTTSGNQLLNPTVTSNNGERHIWIGARIQF
jgi:Carboxypeptidase regulatory-like domain/TonB dependent receptor